MTEIDSELPNPALATAVLEIESHAAEDGWDQKSRLYALVETASLIEREPTLAANMGLDDASAEGSFTPIEQEIEATTPFETVLGSIVWPPTVHGAAAVVERLVLPPSADGQIPEDPAAAQAFAAEHPERQEVRIVAGVTRFGETYCALRLRAHDNTQSVVGGNELVPELVELLRATLEVDPDEEMQS